MTENTTSASDGAALYREALSRHRAGLVLEAVGLYRQALAAQPQMVEAHVNLGSALQALGQTEAAEASFRRAITLAPQSAAAHSNLGVVLFELGRFAESVEVTRRATELRPDFTQAFHNLGNALDRLAQYEEAQAAWRRAVALDPSYAEAYLSLAAGLERQGKTDQAETAYRQVLAARPDYADACNNLGILLLTAGRLEEAIVLLRRACELQPDFAAAHNNLGNALAKNGALDQAVDSYRRAVALEPCFTAAHNNLAHALRIGGMLDAAAQAYRRVLGLQPDFAEAERNLGFTLCEMGRIDEGFRILTQHARVALNAKPASEPLSVSKTRHDLEQSAHLGGVEVQSLRIGGGEALAGPAIHRVPGTGTRWQNAEPKIVVIDDFLTPEALVALRKFCLASTIWREVYKNGYLGAFPEHGLACPLLAQIATELPAAYTAIFGDHRLLQLWAFKYDAAIAGIPLHADFAAVNVNFWITPDEANLDPEHGGLVIWDVAAPLDWDFAKYNIDPAAGREFLRRHGARPVTVPYRANRAVIFDSDLFHETDVIRFREGYANRRINLTLLYGRRGDQGTRRNAYFPV